MNLGAERLQIGDRVGFSGSSVHASGVVIKDIGPDYVRVQWLDCGPATTHRRHALERQPPTGFSKWVSLRSQGDGEWRRNRSDEVHLARTSQ